MSICPQKQMEQNYISKHKHRLLCVESTLFIEVPRLGSCLFVSITFHLASFSMYFGKYTACMCSYYKSISDHLI